jgi:hypothetical protein
LEFFHRQPAGLLLFKVNAVTISVPDVSLEYGIHFHKIDILFGSSKIDCAGASRVIGGPTRTASYRVFSRNSFITAV